MNTRESGLCFAAIMGRLKEALGVSTDASLAALLGMSSSNYSNRKSAGSIPFEAIVPLCTSRFVSIDWLVSGSGPCYTDGRANPPGAAPPVQLDAQLLGTLVNELVEAFRQQGCIYGTGPMHATWFALLAAGMYPAAASQTDPASRRSLIRAEAERLAATQKAMEDAAAAHRAIEEKAG